MSALVWVRSQADDLDTCAGCLTSRGLGEIVRQASGEPLPNGSQFAGLWCQDCAPVDDAEEDLREDEAQDALRGAL